MQPKNYINERAAAMDLILAIMARHHPRPVPRRRLEREYLGAIKQHGGIIPAAHAVFAEVVDKAASQAIGNVMAEAIPTLKAMASHERERTENETRGPTPSGKGPGGTSGIMEHSAGDRAGATNASFRSSNVPGQRGME